MKNRLLSYASDGSLHEIPCKLNPTVQKDLQYVLNSLYAISLIKKECSHSRSTNV